MVLDLSGSVLRHYIIILTITHLFMENSLPQGCYEVY